MRLRSVLFVPGSQPRRFEKAAESGADAVCIDLEDAVAPAAKSEARRTTLAFLGAHAHEGTIGLRINGTTSLDGLRDIVALAESGTNPAFIVVPKVFSASQILQVREVLRNAAGAQIWPLIETPDGIEELPEIAYAAGTESALLFGGADFAACVGSDMSWEALAYARGALVAAAASTGCPAIDVPYLHIDDVAGLAQETRRSKSIGFSGRMAIHPAQVPAINDVFSPTPDEVQHAERILEAFRNAEGGVTVLDRVLVDKPIIRAALRCLEWRG